MSRKDELKEKARARSAKWRQDNMGRNKNAQTQRYATKSCKKCGQEMVYLTYPKSASKWMCYPCERKKTRVYRNKVNRERSLTRKEMIAESKTQKCVKCNSVKLILDFYAEFGCKIGSMATCKECVIKSRYIDKGGRNVRTRFTKAKACAKHNWTLFSLSLEQYTLLVLGKSCCYCNGPLPIYGSGLDRKDSGLGYFYDNCVPCCHVCNSVKNKFFTHDEMIRLGREISLIKQQRGELVGPRLQGMRA